MAFSYQRGSAAPLGANVSDSGTNFSVFSKSALAVELLLFEDVDDPSPAQIISLSSGKNRTWHYWHAFVPGIKAGQIYSYRVHGPSDPERGHCFDSNKVLLDPYGRGVVVPSGYNREAAAAPGSNTAFAMKSVAVDSAVYDWEGDRPLNRPLAKTVIYEMHLAGFTRNPNSGVSPHKRGTYAGLIEKIPYLQDLGVTAIELLPVYHFDEQDCPSARTNYWGYAPISFFSPHAVYSSDRSPLGPVNEFRDMVKALHRAGIEVILDVVYNHTAEGGQGGPILCFKGLENHAYYVLEQGGRCYANYTGTGNTLNANHPVVRRMIVESLRYWVREMHVDGFRFDLASVLSRDENGCPLPNPPVLWDIDSDPQLAGTKLIAEAWDAAGLYQVGRFVGDNWKEWNGKFRDDVRSCVVGWKGSLARIASRLLASPDLYGHEELHAEQSVNFVTCHDGFTLNDLVSYNSKHNEANGEDNRDGSNDNISWNCGVEGPSEDREIDRLRERQIKNLFTLTLWALGTPMILMGDEVRRTQQGNNNAYCQDNELSWFDWSLVKKNPGLHRFVKQMIACRVERDTSVLDEELSLNQLLSRSELYWHGLRLNAPDWSEDSHCLAATVVSFKGGRIFHFMFNFHWEAHDFELPALKERRGCVWRRWVDTSLESPEDISAWDKAPEAASERYYVQPRSVVILLAQV